MRRLSRSPRKRIVADFVWRMWQCCMSIVSEGEIFLTVANTRNQRCSKEYGGLCRNPSRREKGGEEEVSRGSYCFTTFTKLPRTPASCAGYLPADESKLLRNSAMHRRSTTKKDQEPFSGVVPREYGPAAKAHSVWENR